MTRPRVPARNRRHDLGGLWAACLVTVGLIAVVACAAAAFASGENRGEAAINDCARDGVLSAPYSYADLREAERRLPPDVERYSNCGSQLRLARRQAGVVASGLKLTATAAIVPIACPRSGARGSARLAMDLARPEDGPVRGLGSFRCLRGRRHTTARVALTPRSRRLVAKASCVSVRLRVVLRDRLGQLLYTHTVWTRVHGTPGCARLSMT